MTEPKTPSVTTNLLEDGLATGPSEAVSDQHLRLGTRLNEFEIRGVLGEGGFSIVYDAWDYSLERRVALKEYLPSSLASRRAGLTVQPRSARHKETFEAGLRSFVNESRLLARFDHPSLVKVHRFWEANGTAYMVMPLYDGTTLKDTVRTMPAPPNEAWLLALLDPLTAALAVLHRQQCYHRDIAPDNVLLLTSSGRPLLLDFGAARRVVGDMTHVLTVILKPGYAPVEQYGEESALRQGSWTDVYALAAVVHWMVTGKTPPISVGRMVDDVYVPLATRLAGQYSPRFLEAIDRALVVLPSKRTRSIEAFREALGIDVAVGAVDRSVDDAHPDVDDEDPDRTVIKVLQRAGEPLPRTLTATLAATRVADNETSRILPLGPAGNSGEDARVETTLVADLGVPSGARGARRSSKMVIAAGAVLICLGTGIWLLRAPPVAAPSAAAGRAAAAATATSGSSTASEAASSRQTESTPVVAAPVASVPVVSAPVVVPPASLANAPRTATTSRADTPSSTATRSVLPASPASKPLRSAQASREARPQPAAAADSNAAQCARLLQRVSLGDASPATIEQMKNLRCR